MPELTDITIDKEIDARGSFCPGPLMELIRGMMSLTSRWRSCCLVRRSRFRKRYSSLDSKSQT